VDDATEPDGRVDGLDDAVVLADADPGPNHRLRHARGTLELSADHTSAPPPPRCSHPSNNQENLDEDRHGLDRQNRVLAGTPKGEQGRGSPELSLTSHPLSCLRPPSGQAQ
jgi:hypothetical protein